MSGAGLASAPRNMRDRILSDNEIRTIWHADLHYPMQRLLRFMLLTGQLANSRTTFAIPTANCPRVFLRNLLIGNF
jgi:hypothetical protein